MITFKQGIDQIVTVNSADQLLTYKEGPMESLGYETDATIPNPNQNIGTFLYPNSNWPNENSLPLGSKDVYSKTSSTVNIGGTAFNMSNLPTGAFRNADTYLYYQPTSTGVKFLLTSKTWEANSPNGTFISDVNTLKILLYNGTNRDVWGWTSVVSGNHTEFTITAQPLDTSKMIDELELLNKINGLFFGKEWVMNYIDSKLETVIPEAVETAVRGAETIIQQRYVSR